MAFCDITIAQRNANFTNIADTSAQLVSLNSDGSAVLKIGTETAQFIVQNLSQANAKQVLISTGSVLFLAGNYNAPDLECSLVRIVETAVEESVDEPTTFPAKTDVEEERKHRASQLNTSPITGLFYCSDSGGFP